ncbi:response regulator transcription factor [Dorea sp. D27]|uniref:response regulator transcription factor n=1 Tax=Dorea sp. D27 TaxID=658665 RepID=UPI0006737CFA|nr:response regulator transcription factor [Dorea sp. D27]
MSTILIIDDEVDLVTLLEEELQAKGHEVLAAYDGQTGIALSKMQPDLIILDIMMPGRDGFDVCRAIRDDVLCPVIFLSAKQAEADKVKGLTIGADDYITKPFGLRELMARIEASLRREARSQYINAEGRRSKLYFGNLSICIKEREVIVDGKSVPLTKREYDIVELLALHAGQVFSREQIYEKVWGFDSDGDSATVVERIKRIRSKLATAAPGSGYIQTVWGIGYKWNKTQYQGGDLR